MAKHLDIMANPTWDTPIRSFFNDVDINHMRDRTGLDLASYDAVKADAQQILNVVNSDFMPMDPSPKWTAAMKITFAIWVHAGCPKSVPAPGPIAAKPGGGTKSG